MQKVIRILAIVAAVLVCLSLLLLLVTTPFQRLLARTLYGYDDATIGFLPQLPVIPVLFCLFRAGCVALLAIWCGNKRGGIWLEIVLLACLAVILPGINGLVNAVYTPLLYRMQGVNAMAASNVVNSIATLCLIPGGFGQIIAYVVCGMSIVFKKMNKR